MRIGGPVFEAFATAEQWVRAHREAGYNAAYAPTDVDEDRLDEIAAATAAADIVIAEVGAWSNPLSPNETVREAAVALCKERLRMADRLGARCCVNISGSRGELWDGPHPDNFTEETFDLVVETVRGIIDDVKPMRSYFTLETMPWMYPDSPASYRRLIEAIDRERFGVHLDPVNLVCSPQRFYGNGALIRECFEVLGPHIRSCHGKDVVLHEHFLTHLDEVRPGCGGLDYRTFLRELDALPDDVPLMLEHLPSAEEYRMAADHIRSVARDAGIQPPSPRSAS